MKSLYFIFLLILMFLLNACSNPASIENAKTAGDILGNPEYLAMSYGGYRQATRNEVPTVKDLKEDMKILSAMGVRIIRTYNSQQYAQAANLLEAISELKEEEIGFEMYVMLGAWIDCLGAWEDNHDHEKESLENNKAEIDAAVRMANKYPDIVKIIAVGNEAMVHWAHSYFVKPEVNLKWVNHLQNLKKNGGLDPEIWITSSDNFASWGGGDNSYHNESLTDLIRAVDYVSLHTYPFHDTHYNPAFWDVPNEEEKFSEIEKIEAALFRASEYAKSQYQNVVNYIDSMGIEKAVHIGETGWASNANKFYDAAGSAAADEYKEKLYYQHIRDWTNRERISCFYFEAFDEKWKDSSNVKGSENHFGLINLNGEAKFALWDMVDEGVFEGLKRSSFEITKSYGGDMDSLLKDVFPPPLSKNLDKKEKSN